MATRCAQLLHQLRQLAAASPSESASDAVLLDRFVRRQDQDAFAALVARHGPMVFRVCRRALADVHAAEDCFQATFLIAARKAGSLRRPDALAAFLHAVACRVAHKARAATCRRPSTPTPGADEDVIDPRPDPPAELTARELLQAVDEEVQRLPEVYRAPVVLCCLEGRTREEAAELLGWTPGSVKGRLERGRARLHARLVRRGLLPAVALAAVEVSRGVAPAGVVATLAGATVRAALAFAAGREVADAGVSVRVGALAREGLKGMAAVKVKLGIVLLLLAAGAAAALQAPGPAQPQAGDGQPLHREPHSQARTDRYGDPLPEGAFGRLGTVRFRHGNGANLAFAPDDRSLLTCGADRTIRTWDAATGRMVREQRLPPSPYTSVLVLSPDGRLLAVQDFESQDSFSLWDVERNRLRFTLPLGERWWHRAAFSPDGRTLVTAQYSGILRAWDVTTGRGRLLGRHKREIRTLAFTADGTLVSMSMDKTLRFWDLALGRERSCRTLPENVSGAAVSPDGRVVAIWSWSNPELDKGLEFWDAVTGKPAEGWVAPDCKGVRGVWFAPDRRTVLVGTAEGVVVWDPRAGKRIRTLPAGSRSDLTFSHDGKTVAAFGGRDPNFPCGTALRLWDLESGAPRAAQTAENGHLHEVDGVAFAPDGRTVATSCRTDRCVRLWEAGDGRLLRSLPLPDEVSCHALAFSPDGKNLFAGTSPAVVRWEVATGREAGRYPLAEAGKAERHHLLHMQLTGDGRTLLAVSQILDGGGRSPALHAWDVATGKRLRSGSLGPNEASFAYGRFSDDGRLFILPGGEIHDAATGEELFRLGCDDGQFSTAVAISADSALLALGIWQKINRPNIHGHEMVAVRAWEVATREPVVWLETGEAAHVAFTPDGRRLVTAGLDSLTLWDLSTGKAVARRPAPGRFRGSFGPSFASALAVAPDGRTVATGQADTTALLWDLAPPKSGPLAELTAAQREACWADLAGADGGAAMIALARLADRPETAVALVRKRLRPAQPPSAAELRRLLADLDAPEFERRESATRRLAGWGETAHAALREALRAKPSAEVRRRLEELLADPRLVRQPEARRAVRAVRLLECIGSPAARQVLGELAKGMPEARLTRDTKAALDRLSRRPAALP
jgi:RNA polymerase sigma factor (sigma-70 family)